MNAHTARDLNRVMRKFSETDRKYVTAQIKQSPTDGSGRFTAFVSPFGPPPDTFGDIISPGAYEGTIMQATIEYPGELWTIWYNHQYTDPANAIGVVTAAAESSQGLVIEGQLNLDSERAMIVYEAMLKGVLREFSIGYGVVAYHRGTWQDQSVRFLDELELLEISVVWKGAAFGTRLIEVRSQPTTTSTGANATATWTNVPEPESELKAVNARIDAIASGEKPRDPAVVNLVDALIHDVREELVRESLDRAEAAAWEERMRINMVLAPAPVRVDARMRPVTS